MRMISRTTAMNLGLLILRVGLGGMFLSHGVPKLLAGPELWGKVGMAMGNLGIHAYPVVWGFLAACSESVGGVLLALGLFTRVACVFLTATMTVAAIMHLSQGDGLTVASHAIEAGIVFFSLLFIGPGAWSLDRRVFGR